MDALTEFLNNGGCIFVMMSEGGEQKADTNINFLLEQYGISVNNGILNQLLLLLSHDILRYRNPHDILQVLRPQRGFNFEWNFKPIHSVVSKCFNNE